MDLVTTFFAVALSLPGGVMFALGGIVVWVLRKYMTKNRPDEVAAIDAFGTKYGKEAEAEFRKFIADLKG